MEKRWKNSRQWIQLLGYRLPFTWYFAVFCIMALLVLEWLRAQQRIPGTSFYDIFVLLIQVAVFFVAALVGLALLTVLVSFLFLLWQKRKGKIAFTIDSAARLNHTKQKQLIHLRIHPVLKPLLGFVKIRLQYDETRFSRKFSVVETSRKKIFSTTIDGTYQWALPEIKEYTIHQAIFYLEDFFQFFSFTLVIPCNNHFYTQPLQVAGKVLNASPRKTEDTNTRIEELKKIEGEYLSYKNFENHDDVRRIVWKIYAKNKELVVRTPEILDPYASHIYLYASFYTHFDVSGSEVVNIPFLNHYKTMIWNAYRELEQQGLEVRYVPDQPIAQQAVADPKQAVQYSISTSKWQTDKPLSSYLRPNETAILFISSLSDPEQVSRLVEQYGYEIVFVFVRLSGSLKKQHIGDWLQWLFVQNEQNDIARYKTAWSLSLLRSKLLANEKKLSQLLEKYQKPVLI
jgi:hypothetical protein